MVNSVLFWSFYNTGEAVSIGLDTVIFVESISDPDTAGKCDMLSKLFCLD